MAATVEQEGAIYNLGAVLAHALALKSSVLFLCADEQDEQRLLELIAAAKRAATALGATLWAEEEGDG